MGCVVFFVLTKGNHPFGNPAKRQANIAAGDYHLAQLHGPGVACPECYTLRRMIYNPSLLVVLYV